MPEPPPIPEQSARCPDGGEIGSALAGALTSAAATCRQVGIDYQAGLLSDGEALRAVVRSGVVITADQVWLLDTTTGHWWRYHGEAPAPVALDAPGAFALPTDPSTTDGGPS